MNLTLYLKFTENAIISLLANYMDYNINDVVQTSVFLFYFMIFVREVRGILRTVLEELSSSQDWEPHCPLPPWLLTGNPCFR